MKTTKRTLWSSLTVVFLGTLLAGTTHGQIFVTNTNTNSSNGFIGEYDYNTGATVNATLVSGLNYPWGIAVSGSNLYVANNTAQTIGEYNATSGAPVNAALVSGLNGPDGIAVSGSNLFVANSGYGSGTTVGKYNASTGATVNASLVSGLSSPTGIAVSGSNLYVANINTGTIGEYNASTGATVHASLVSGLNQPIGIAVSGSNLYVANAGSGTIGEYNATTGATVKNPLVSGLSSPQGIAVVGANLFVVNQGTGTIGEYNATTGATVHAAFISGLKNPIGIAVVATPQQFIYLGNVPLPSNAWGAVNINEALNKIYTSGNPYYPATSNSTPNVFVLNGSTLLTTPGNDAGAGSNVSVDTQTSRYWAATNSGGGVVVFDGTTDSIIKTVPLSEGCPIDTSYDFFKGRIWVGAQCGGGNDPIFAIDANTFQVVHGPIGSGGVMGSIIANGANGRLYFYDPQQGISGRVNPTTFAVTTNPFQGEVMAIDAATNKLYTIASSGNTSTLQIFNGAPDPEAALTPPIPLSYVPSGMDINVVRNELYLTNPGANTIEIRNPSTGALLTTFALSSYGITPNGSIAVDSTRSRIYVIQNPSNGSGPALLVIDDVRGATSAVGVLSARCIRSH